jgi:hypothetical protein
MKTPNHVPKPGTETHKLDIGEGKKKKKRGKERAAIADEWT